MFEIVRYTPDKVDEWNSFVDASKNGTFLFFRDYMDYHADRFKDCSLMFYREGKLYALLPANENDHIFYSHQGLTFGGLIMDVHTDAASTIVLFHELNDYLRMSGFLRVVYKAIPWIYHQLPAQEDLYAIFRECRFQITVRNLSCTIVQPNAIRWERVRRRAVKRAQIAGIRVEESRDATEFWQVLSDNLMQKYGARPVHTLSEIKMLQKRFPLFIQLFNAYIDDRIVGGIMVYISRQVVHAQYSSATVEGQQVGAIDFIYDHLINHAFKDYKFFDFGTSNEENGRILNESLIFQKEGFGGRGVCYDWYEWGL